MITLILSKIRTNKFVTFLTLILLILFLLPKNGFAKEGEDSNMNNPFGVLEFLHWDHPWNSYKYSTLKDLEKVAKLIKEAGIGWVRVDFLWADIEPEAGKFSFKKYDQIVSVLNKYNIHILGILDYSADWAASCREWNCPPEYNSLFVNYAKEVVNRYKDRIKYWEIWNEPDSATYWSKQDGLKSYCALLKDVYTALKEVDPECKILNGGLANGLSSVNRLYENGAKDYFDILNIHFFQNPLHPGSIKAVAAYPKLAYKVMVRNGDGNKKIWITEIGCPGLKRGVKTEGWWLGKNPTEKKQAEWVKQVYTQLLKEKTVDKIFWAFFRDCSNHWNTGVDYFGLVRWNFSKKPAFDAYKECFNKWKNKQ